MKLRAKNNHHSCCPAAFTLIEIMVVVAVMGIVLAAGIPSLMGSMRKEGIRKAANDVMEVCEKARAQAIMTGRTMEVHFRPQEGTMSVQAASSAVAGQPEAADEIAAPSMAFSGFSAKLPESVAFEMLDVNLMEFNAMEDAAVHFFPDGRCDEMTVILLSDKGERRAVTLEITTSLATMYNDPRDLLQ